MAGRINTNTQADFSNRLLKLNQKDQEGTLKRLAAGLRINSASDDAAGLAISERLTSLSRGFEQAQSNLQDGASALQVADGGLSQISDSLQRIRELSVQASSDTLNDSDRANIQKEVDQLVAEVDRQAGSTQFNSQNLLSGQFDGSTDSFNVQAGADSGESIDVAISEVSSATLGVGSIDVSTRAGAEAALGSLDAALTSVTSERASIGASLNRLNQANEFAGVARENTLSALSTLRDADFGDEATKLAIGKIKNQANVSALAQANLNPQNALRLLGQ